MIAHQQRRCDSEGDNDADGSAEATADIESMSTGIGVRPGMPPMQAPCDSTGGVLGHLLQIERRQL